MSVRMLTPFNVSIVDWWLRIRYRVHRYTVTWYTPRTTARWGSRTCLVRGSVPR